MQIRSGVKADKAGRLTMRDSEIEDKTAKREEGRKGAGGRR